MTDVTTPAAVGGTVIDTDSIGAAWIGVARAILERGIQSSYDGLPMREIMRATLQVQVPASHDRIIERFADPERLAWMHANFHDHSRVTALGDADSYATRLYDYDRSGRDQLNWVIERLQADPLTRSATITTFQPHTDTSYVPCVSLLDFFLLDGRLCLAVYAHSIDFGAKGYGNLVELAVLQEQVANAVGAPAGQLSMLIKSAHVYATEYAYMADVLAQAAQR